MGQFSLDESENQAVQAGAGGTVKSAAVARLYTAPDGSWHYAHLWGAAALVSDDSDVLYLRLVDLSSGQITWEQEIYEGFDYQSPTAFFHTFEGSESVVGLSFADEQDAGYFYEAVTSAAHDYGAKSGGGGGGGGASYSTLPPVPTSTPSLPPKPAIRSPGPPPPSSVGGGGGGGPAPPPRPAGGPPPRPSDPAPAPPIRGPSHGSGLDAYPSTPTPAPAPAPAVAPSPAPAPAPAPTPVSPQPVTRGGSFIGGGGSGSKRAQPGKKKGWFSKITEKIGLGEEQGQPDIVLGGPTGFRHESHIGWDPSAGFEIRNIPPEWRKLFQAAGVKKSELKDGATAQFIMETVVEATMGMNPVAPARPGGGGAPAPPPAPGAPAPPPAPSAPPPPSAPFAPPPPSAPGAPPPPSIHAPAAGGGGLLASLQTATLKSVDQRAVPDLNHLDEAQGANLADTLAKAMAARRVDLGADEPEEELGSEDEWSD